MSWGARLPSPQMDDDALLGVLHDVTDAIERALGELDDWGLAGTHAGQHHSDLAADEAALEVLDRAGLGVLSEESGLHHADRDIVVVVDPLDGSTNAARGIPWYAASLCAVDRDGPRAAVVTDLVRRTRFEALRGGGARRDGVPLHPSTTTEIDDALVGLSGYAWKYLGWKQYRVLGAAALDLCAVAAGTIDGYVDCSWNAHGPWDYLGGLLVCREAGAHVVDATGRDLVVVEHEARRTPIAAATPELLAALVEARSSFATPGDEVAAHAP